MYIFLRGVLQGELHRNVMPVSLRALLEKKKLGNKINRQYLLLEVHHQNYIQQYYFLVNLNRSQEKREVFTFVKKDKRFY